MGSFPASGESPEAAAVRETLEETGLTVKVGRVLGERDHPDSGRHLSTSRAK